MGKKKKQNTLLTVPKTGGGSIIDPKESDPSDLESLSVVSTAGDSELLDTEDDDQFYQINSLAGLVEEAQDKKIDIRTKSINLIISILSKYYIPEHLLGMRTQFFDIIEKNMKKTTSEAMKMCTLASLMAIQLGYDAEEWMCSLSEILKVVAKNPSAAEDLRSTSAQSLALCVYLCIGQFDKRYEALQTLKDVWSSFKPLSADSTTLFISSLHAWILILEKFDRSVINSSMELQPKFFLESAAVEARISTGEALAILYEIATASIDEDFQFKNHDDLEVLLADLAMDSVKFRAKRDKKLQRMTFRQINDTIFGEKVFCQEIQFNRREKLTIRGCHQKLLYDSLCQFLRGDLNRHLTSNEHLRQLFGLGGVLEPEEVEERGHSKKQKEDIMSQYEKQSKNRNIERSKFRARKQNNRHYDYELE